MTSDSPNKETNTIVDLVECRPGLKPIWEYDWKTESVRQMPRTPMVISWYGIVLAAGCYPVVLVILLSGYGFLVHGLDFFSPDMSQVFVGALVLFALFFAGVLYGMIMSIPVYLLLQLFGWVSGGVISVRGASGVYGGLIGFLASTGGGLFFLNVVRDAQYDFELLACLIFPPLLAIVMGYVGAVWAGYRNRNKGFPFFEPLFGVEQQFTIGFLLKSTTLVAVLVVVCKAAGKLGLYVGILWAAYVVVQVLLLLCDHWVQRWIGGDKSLGRSHPG